jgi:hypothetical protein
MHLQARQSRGTPPIPEMMETMGKFIEQSFQEGFRSLPKAAPSALGACVRSTVTNPFAESKEIAGGSALIQAKSKEEAIEFTKRFLKVAGDGETESRQLSEQPAK